MEMIKSMKIIIDKSMETKISQNRGTLNIRRSSEGYKISDRMRIKGRKIPVKVHTPGWWLTTDTSPSAPLSQSDLSPPSLQSEMSSSSPPKAGTTSVPKSFPESDMSGSSSSPSEEMPGSSSSPSEEMPGSSSSHSEEISDSSSSPSEEMSGSSSSPSQEMSVKVVQKNRPSTYMTKSRHIIKQKKNRKSKTSSYQEAISEFRSGAFPSVRKCAAHFKLSKTTLLRLMNEEKSFLGSGRKSKVFTDDEEDKILKFIVSQQELGCGLSWLQLQLLLQEVMQSLKNSNKERITGYEDQNHLPNIHFVRRFATRHSLTLRKTLEISKGRAVCTVADLEQWQSETAKYLLENPKFLECFSDPRRIWNQDESSVECGNSGQKVLAPIGSRILYSVSGCTREHVTTSFIASAAGDLVPPRTIHKGVRNVAAQHLQNLPKDGKSGAWGFSVSEKGFINRELFLQVLVDLDEYLTKNKVSRPVILFMDGASPHLSLAAADFCSSHEIQPWLFKPNFTHLLQPLDLSFFSSLKKELKKLAWMWQTNPANTGQVLNKYSVIGVLHTAVENCLDRTNLIQSGFKRAGIYPWDTSAPDRSKLNPSKVYTAPTDSPQPIPSSSEDTTPITSESVSFASSGLSSSTIDQPPAPITFSSAELSSSTDLNGSSSSQLLSFDPASLLSPETSSSGYDVPADNGVSMEIEGMVDLDTSCDPIEDTYNGENTATAETSILSDISNIDPPLSSTINSGLNNKTYICSGCKKRILKRFEVVHSPNCIVTVQPSHPAATPLINISAGHLGRSTKAARHYGGICIWQIYP